MPAKKIEKKAEMLFKCGGKIKRSCGGKIKRKRCK